MKLEHIEEARDLAARLKNLYEIHAAQTPRGLSIEIKDDLAEIGLGTKRTVGFHPEDSLWKAMIWEHINRIEHKLKMLGVEI